jgi:hypothetical protein
VAVDREIVGKDSDAELIGGGGLLGLFPLVDRDVASIDSLFLGEDEKSWDRRLDLTEGALMAIPPFPEEGEKDGELVEVSLEELLLNRRGIAEGSSEAVSGVDARQVFTVGVEGRGGRVGSLHAASSTN